MVNQVFPHDLLWGMRASMLPLVGVPSWVYEVIENQWPVVVRRGVAPEGKVAVGIRGRYRHERYAAFMPLTAICRVVRPQDLIGVHKNARDVVRDRVKRIERVMLENDWVWGYGGSLGFELACGVPQVTESSDVDILLWSSENFDNLRKFGEQRLFAKFPFHTDIQVQTVWGAFSLSEWLLSETVLLKTEQGPVLVSFI